jgi:hypothetical protein
MKNYCSDLQGGLWFQLDPLTDTWMAKPCCLYKKSYPVYNSIDKEFWNNADIIKQRQDNIDGHDLPAECHACKITEDNNNYSRRMSWNDRFGTSDYMSESVIEIDIQSDFSCNLACSICSPVLSTTWRKYDTHYIKNDQRFKVRQKSKNVIDFFQTANVSNLRQIHFQGGEPFLSNSHIEILEAIAEKTDPGSITVWYHSNGTQQVSDRVLKLWEKFQLVEIYFSLDDIGPRMEYQRWPMSWQQVHDNMMWAKSNLTHNSMIKIERTASVLNSFWVNELEHWKKENFDQTCFGDPIPINYHSCYGDYDLQNAVTSEYKSAVLEKFSDDHWIHKTFLNIKTDQDHEIKRMLKKLHLQDQERNLDWSAVYPEFKHWYRRYL